MASLLIVQDPDGVRRGRYLRGVRERGAPAAGLAQGGCGCGDVELVWWVAAGAPVSWQSDDSGLTVVLGDALGGVTDTFLDARAVREAWSVPATGRAADLAAVAPFDGFHVAASFDVAARRLVAGVDLFGVFPLFYWADAEVLLAGTSPELFLGHPRFGGGLDTLGLAALLLTDRGVGGRTLLGGARRLAGSHLLIREGGEAPRELRQYRFAASDRYHGLPVAEQIDLIESETARCIRRQSKPGARQATLLSGGRDSRMVAAYLVDRGVRPAALTFGDAADHDALCAQRVARRLGLNRHLHDYPAEQYPHYAAQTARWEHGGNGFGAVYAWGMAAPLEPLGDRVFTGYYLDALLSPPALLTQPSSCEFPPLFAGHKLRGLGTATLSALLRPDVFGDALDQLEAEVHQSYLDHGDHAVGRTWSFYLHERVRHMIGCVPWRLTFGAWPVLPALDRRWIDTMAGMPPALLVERRAQDALLRRRFPQLNRTPIARPNDDTTPLEPGLLRRVRHAVAARPVMTRAGRLVRRVWPREHRYYYRINDFNGTGWRAIRRAAEPHRRRLHDLFDAQVLATVLPPPETDVRLHDGLLSAAGLRSLVGVLVWAGRHL